VSSRWRFGWSASGLRFICDGGGCRIAERIVFAMAPPTKTTTAAMYQNQCSQLPPSPSSAGGPVLLDTPVDDEDDDDDGSIRPVPTACEQRKKKYTETRGMSELAPDNERIAHF
jgi:hypothetical protein